MTKLHILAFAVAVQVAMGDLRPASRPSKYPDLGGTVMPDYSCKFGRLDERPENVKICTTHGTNRSTKEKVVPDDSYEIVPGYPARRSDRVCPRCLDYFKTRCPHRSNVQCRIGGGSKIHWGWLEPSTFDYQGLGKFDVPGKTGKKEPYYMEPSNGGQKKSNYDQFLRSNIDNEQDNRNFHDEDGQDHLPFRTWQGEVLYPGKKTVHYRGITPLLTMEAGDSRLVPMYWNNPHASELEVNIWIFQHGAGNKAPIVVPIKKPTCSGEGYQSTIVKFTIPEDFVELGSKIPGFKGCTAQSQPKCTLQIYAHSVESRQYASGIPIVIQGHKSNMKTTSTAGIQPVSKDPWMDLAELRELCLSSMSPEADIRNAVPKWARLVSDVYTHTYMNSDFSPYSGQQHESISQNLQASAVNKMVTGNRGELGRHALPGRARGRIRVLQNLEDRIYKNYETLANNIAADVERMHYFNYASKMPSKNVPPCTKLGKVFNYSQSECSAASEYMTTGVIDTAKPGEELEKVGFEKWINAGNVRAVLDVCFRCAETASLYARRLQTNTYIPSFQLPQAMVHGARTRSLSGKYAKYNQLMSDSGMVRIYAQTMQDLWPFFFVSQSFGVVYQQAMLKDTMRTKPDSVNYRIKKVASPYLWDHSIGAIQAFTAYAEEFAGCPEHCLRCKLPRRFVYTPDKWAGEYGWPLYCKYNGRREENTRSSTPCTGENSKYMTEEGTCLSGACAGCKKLFSSTPGNPSFVPQMTPLATEIVKNGVPGIGTAISAYPDPDGSPRIGRPAGPLDGGSTPPPVPKDPVWNITTRAPTPAPTPAPTAPAPATTSAPPTPAPGSQRRRRGTRRRSSRRRRSTRRRTSRRRRRSRSKKSKKMNINLEELYNEVSKSYSL